MSSAASNWELEAATIRCEETRVEGHQRVPCVSARPASRAAGLLARGSCAQLPPSVGGRVHRARSADALLSAASLSWGKGGISLKVTEGARVRCPRCPTDTTVLLSFAPHNCERLQPVPPRSSLLCSRYAKPGTDAVEAGRMRCMVRRER
eukprot:2811528-Rhodomonas_salina.1